MNLEKESSHLIECGGFVRKRSIIGVIIVVCVSLGILALVYAPISFAVEQASNDDMSILGYEMLCESGYNFTSSAKRLEEMISTFAKLMDERHRDIFTMQLFGECDIEKGLERLGKWVKQ